MEFQAFVEGNVVIIAGTDLSMEISFQANKFGSDSKLTRANSFVKMEFSSNGGVERSNW